MRVSRQAGEPPLSGLFDAPRIVSELGILEARTQATSPLQRVCIDAAETTRAAPKVLSRQIFGSIAMTYLPYRNPGPSVPVWNARCGPVSYTLLPGPRGYPYGAKARILLLHLFDHAIRSPSEPIEIHPSGRSWLRDLGIPPGGSSYRLIAEQVRRLSEVRFELSALNPSLSPGIESPFTHLIRGFEIDRVGGASHLILPTELEDRPELMSRVLLDPNFVRYAQQTQIVLDRVAVEQIGDNGWALDLYVWLARELPLLRATVFIDWMSFLTGFGDQIVRHRIKARVLDTLPLVKAVYPNARVTVDRAGVTLSPSYHPCNWSGNSIQA